MKVFLIDLSMCGGCYNCQIACKDEHCGNDWTPYARPQPDTGQFWLKIHEEEKGTIPKLRVAYMPVLCQHCRDASCMTACPIEGAIYRREDGLVVIDPHKCTGCRSCVAACPYGCIYYNEDLHLAQKCTGCAHLLDRGWKEPRCADSCPTQAIKLIDESELKNVEGTLEQLHPEYGTRPGVYYLNMPKRFIAGTVYDPAIKRIVAGALCTLTGQNKTRTATTDGFGDFWFEKLDEGDYSLKIEAKDHQVKTFDNISTKKDVNLGDIPLLKNM
jgi:tetrathionate reductase subunit B